MSLWRAFIALDISQNVRLAIHQATTQLRKETGSLIRWVSSENMHLTLKFLGDVSPDQVKQLTQSLDSEAKLHTPFEMEIGRLRAFPNIKRTRVIVFEITAPPALGTLAKAVETVCVRLGHDPESHAFHPHLTLGRVRQGLSIPNQEKIRHVLETTTIDFRGTTRVDSVQIYRSNLNSHGAVYMKLFSAPFHTVIASHDVVKQSPR